MCEGWRVCSLWSLINTQNEWPTGYPPANSVVTSRTPTHTHTAYMLSRTCTCTFVPGEKRIWFSFISPRAVGSQRSRFIHLLFPFQPCASPPLFWCLLRTCCPIVHVFSPETQALLCVLVMSSLPGLLIDRHTQPWVGMTLLKQQHHVSGWGLVTENTLGTLAAPQVARSEMSHSCCWRLCLIFQQVAKLGFF